MNNNLLKTPIEIEVAYDSIQKQSKQNFNEDQIQKKQKKNCHPYNIYIYIDEKLRSILDPEILNKIQPKILEIIKQSIKTNKKNDQIPQKFENSSFKYEISSDEIDNFDLQTPQLTKHSPTRTQKKQTNKKIKSERSSEPRKTAFLSTEKKQKNMCYNNFEIFNRENLSKIDNLNNIQPQQVTNTQIASIYNLSSYKQINLYNNDVSDEACLDHSVIGKEKSLFKNPLAQQIEQMIPLQHELDYQNQISQTKRNRKQGESIDQLDTENQVIQQDGEQQKQIPANLQSNPLTRLNEIRDQQKKIQGFNNIPKGKSLEFQQQSYNSINQINIQNEKKKVVQSKDLKQMKQFINKIGQSPPRKQTVPNLFFENCGFNPKQLKHSIPSFINKFKQNSLNSDSHSKLYNEGIHIQFEYPGYEMNDQHEQNEQMFNAMQTQDQNASDINYDNLYYNMLKPPKANANKQNQHYCKSSYSLNKQIFSNQLGGYSQQKQYYSTQQKQGSSTQKQSTIISNQSLKQ